MQTIEYRTVDKSGWGDGPWRDEPNKVQWQDEATGLPCLIVRNRSGALCGYVGVPSAHPWHGVAYCQPIDPADRGGDDEWRKPSPERFCEVHGGLTFSGACGHGDDESVGICHKPEPGEPDDVWWFGFDCAHAWDISPAPRMRFSGFGVDEVYRDITYVRRQVASLARQLASRSPAVGS